MIHLQNKHINPFSDGLRAAVIERKYDCSLKAVVTVILMRGWNILLIIQRPWSTALPTTKLYLKKMD